MKKNITFILAVCICVFMCACGGKAGAEKSPEAQKADELILAIGEVTADSGEAIVAAEEHYNTLTEEQKSEVESYDTLVAAKAAFEEFISKWKIDYYVGSDGNKTDEAFLIGTFGGTNVLSPSGVSYDLKVHAYYMPKDKMFTFRVLDHGTDTIRYSRENLINLTFEIDNQEYKVECMGSSLNYDIIFSDHYGYEDSALKKANNTDREQAYDMFVKKLVEDGGNISCSICIGPYFKVSNGFGDQAYTFTLEGKGMGRLLAEITE